jgi:hypothetical protein
MKGKFILANVLLTGLMIALTAVTFKTLTKTDWPHWSLYFIYGWLFVAAMIGYSLVENKMKSRPRDFVNTFMLTSGMRMLISIFIIVILVLEVPVAGRYVSIYYVLGYLLFLVVEVIFLFNRSKQLK